MKIQALEGCFQCIEACGPELQEGDPFEYRNFVATVTQVPKYDQNMQTLGTF